MIQTRKDKSPLLIVGAGPTGLAASLFLSRRGVPVRIVEKRSQPALHSRALGVNPRTLSLLEDTGVTSRMLAEGWRLQAVNIHFHGRQVGHLSLGTIRHKYPFMLVLSQERSEALLEEVLAQQGVGVERDRELTGIRTIGGDCIQAEITLPGSGTELLETHTLLGADGAHSAVRRLLGIDFPGSTFPETWALADLELDLKLARDEGHIFLQDTGVIFALRVQGDVWRVIGNMPDTLENLTGYLPPGAKTGATIWKSDFSISHRLATRFSAGCACLAGDAAHIHSPFGARGMNLGIEDAYVLAALAAEGRLAEYDALRRPVDARVVRMVERITQIPRGHTRAARAVRALAPVLGSLLPFARPFITKWVTGLDHEVGKNS